MGLVAQIEILNAKLSMSAFGAMHGLAVSCKLPPLCRRPASLVRTAGSARPCAGGLSARRRRPCPPAAACCCCPVLCCAHHCPIHLPADRLHLVKLSPHAGRGSQAGGAGAGHAERADGGGHGAGNAGACLLGAGQLLQHHNARTAALLATTPLYRAFLQFLQLRSSVSIRLEAHRPIRSSPPVPPRSVPAPLICRSTAARCWALAWASQPWMPSRWMAQTQRQRRRQRQRQRLWLRPASTQLRCRRRRREWRRRELAACPGWKQTEPTVAPADMTHAPPAVCS